MPGSASTPRAGGIDVSAKVLDPRVEADLLEPSLELVDEVGGRGVHKHALIEQKDCGTQCADNSSSAFCFGTDGSSPEHFVPRPAIMSYHLNEIGIGQQSTYSSVPWAGYFTMPSNIGEVLWRTRSASGA